MADSQRDESLHAMLVSEVSIYTADMFIFLDETGTDRRDALRRYAYSWRGLPALAHKLLVKGQYLSSIAIMSSSGVLDCQVAQGTVDGDVFYDFVQSRVLPHLMPFNGINPHKPRLHATPIRINPDSIHLWTWIAQSGLDPDRLAFTQYPEAS